MLNMLKDCLIVKASNGAVAGTTEVDSSIIDAKGYDAVCFIVDLGTVTAGSVLTAQAQDNAANSTSGMANAGTAATYTDVAAESSNTILVTEVINIGAAASKRYIRCKFTRTTQNAVVNSIIAILHRSKNRPVTLDASVIASALSNASS